MKEIMEERYQAREEKVDVTIANNGSNDLTRRSHDLYHGNLKQQMSKIGARLKKEAQKYGIELRTYPHRENVWHYDIRQAVQEIMSITHTDKVVLDNIDGKSVTLWIEAGILIIKNPNFSVNHAGRNEMAVYARDDRGVAHEKTELGLWMDFVFNPGKYGAYNMRILHPGSTMEPEAASIVLIGDRIMEWANRTVENRMPVNNRPLAESLRRRFHQMACQIEFNHILDTKVENAEIGIGTAGLAYEKIPLRAIEYMMNNGMDITVVENGADSLEPDLLTLAPLENRLIVSEQCLRAHSPQWFEYRILTYIHYRKLIGAGRTLDERLAGEAQAESRALFDIYLRCRNGERFAPDIMIDLRRFGNDITHAWTLQQELDLFNSVKQRFRDRLSRTEQRILDRIPDEYIFDMAHNIIGNDLDERLVSEEERQETNLYDDVFDPFIASERLPGFQEEAAKIHSENLGHSPAIPDKTILCHIITDSILPAGQRNMLKILEQDMRNDKYSEKVIALSNTDPENSEDFMAKLEAVKAREELRYPGYKVRFDVACPKQNLVGMVQSKGMQALAFSTEGDGDIVQIEGIILALRALQTGNINNLLNIYKLLTNKDATAGTSDIDELARMILFVLPVRKADVDKIGMLNKIIEENIKTAA